MEVKLLVTLLCLPTLICCMPISENNHNKNIEEKEGRNIYRLPNDVVPLHYDIRLVPHIFGAGSPLEGEERIIVHIQKETSKIILHSKNITIHENITTVENVDGDIFHPKQHYYESDTQMLHLLFNNTFMPGIYFLNITFNSTSNYDLSGFYNSFYENEDHSEVWMAATHLQSISARRVFPCWDEPALKATFKISIKHFKNYTALSNMPLYQQEIDENDGKVWSHFKTTPIMSTNILAFVVADYMNITNEDGSTSVWTRKSAIPDVQYVLNVTQEATARFEEYLNSSVRVPKMDHVTIPQYSSRATENWGLITYLEGPFVYDPTESRTAYKMDSIMTIVHEIAHQWFGNLVSPSWWKYFWMSEGMATYFKFYMTDKLYKDWRLPELFVVRMQQQSSFNADERYNVEPMNRKVNTPQEIRRRDVSIVYRKSAAVIRMLSHIVTEKVFHTGLIKYIDANQYNSVTSDDLWKAMQEAFNESGGPSKEFQVKEVMDTWVEQTGYPIVTITRDYDTGTMTVHQESATEDQDPLLKKWWIPFNYATETNPNFLLTSPTFWLKPDIDNMTIAGIDNHDWIIANVQQTGYYRVNYDERNWKKIGDFLNSDHYEKIHVINRAQILDDAYNMLKRKRLNPTSFIHIINYLSREIDFIPWQSVFGILSIESKYLAHPDGEEILKPYIAGLMNNLIETIGFDETSDESDIKKVVRVDILSWACRLDHAECKRKATEKLVAHLENPEANQIPVNLKQWTYCMGLMQANESIWNKVLHSDNLSYEIITYLGCSENSSIIEMYLQMSIDGHSDLWKSHSTDVIETLNRDISPHAETLLNFVTNNWEKIVAMTEEQRNILENLLYRIKSQEQLEKFKAFLVKIGLQDDIATSYRERSIQKIERDVKIIRDYLSEYINRNKNEVSIDVTQGNDINSGVEQPETLKKN